jgi:anhydro-N-acetylmuramic acid kinase
MSGTSLDGLDLALCRFEGFGLNTKVGVLNFTTVSFDEEFKEKIRAVFSKRNVDLEQVCLMNAFIGRRHADIINSTLSEWNIMPDEIDLIASHGQTIYHAPSELHQIAGMPDATLQIGDGDHIAVGTGIITLSDFRQKHIAAGGEGAPLAIYGDYLVFSKEGENRIMLNIGGIANFSFLPADQDGNKVFSTDVGPGNTIMDAFVQKTFPGKAYDKDSIIASKGTINTPLLGALLDHSFFNQEMPKTTGPELFNLAFLSKAQEKSGIQDLPPEDIMATLNRFTAEGIALALKKCFDPGEKFTVYLSGGGMHNSLLMKNIQSIFPSIEFKNTETLGIHPDAKEAVLFAILANECLAEEVTGLGGSAKVPSVRMGKISLPD